ncbi:hypothetical protein BDV28DRAFT_144080 [Aspergillus coremiiformis]|uniref:Ser-Thr-rich glycosyl-phosphatidyl-inositol-anchored membrane family-domain-containing protein n=1 Tax=Aspergillus coremiiformis TaxID=138285 RepID=A0A5N6YUY5_9EURO|nr:hypothetical protein BDV28DRAFT_144080 [Aspergillus coremiiformis]
MFFSNIMQLQTLSLLLLAAPVLAAPEAQGGLNPADVPFQLPPSSIMSVLLTAIPPASLQQFADPSARSAMMSEVSAGHLPDWYNNLPSDVKSYVSTAYQAYAEPTGTGAQATAGSPATTGAKATATSGSDSHSNTSSSAAGAAPTGAIAASLVGAAGILGLAIAL